MLNFEKESNSNNCKKSLHAEISSEKIYIIYPIYCLLELADVSRAKANQFTEMDQNKSVSGNIRRTQLLLPPALKVAKSDFEP